MKKSLNPLYLKEKWEIWKREKKREWVLKREKGAESKRVKFPGRKTGKGKR